jgi:hypothetical protein
LKTFRRFMNTKYTISSSKDIYGLNKIKLDRNEYNNTLYSVENIIKSNDEYKIVCTLVKYSKYKNNKSKYNILHSRCLIQTVDSYWVFGFNKRYNYIGGVYELENDRLTDTITLIVGAKREIVEELQIDLSQISEINLIDLQSNTRGNYAFIFNVKITKTKNELINTWKPNSEQKKLIFSQDRDTIEVQIS